MLLSYQGILRSRYISHGLCIVYDVRAVEHNFRTRVLDLHMSCRNGLPQCLSPQNDRAHTKPRSLCMFYKKKQLFDIPMLSIKKKVEKHQRLKVVCFYEHQWSQNILNRLYIKYAIGFLLLLLSVFCLFGRFFLPCAI